MTKIISCINDKGGSCKTTTIYSLATQKALDGFNVLMIDLDVSGSLSAKCGVTVDSDESSCATLLRPKRAGMHPTWTPDEILDGIYTVDAFSDYVKKHNSNASDIPDLYIIPAGPSGDLITTQHMLRDIRGGMGADVLKDMLKTLGKSKRIAFDYVFIDAPGSFDDLCNNVMRASTHVIIPFEPNKDNYDCIEEVWDSLASAKSHTKLKVLGTLACRTKRRASEWQIIEDADKKWGVIGRVKESSDVQKCDNKGIAITLGKPYSETALGYKAVADLI